MQSEIEYIRQGSLKIYDPAIIYASRSNIKKQEMYAIVEIAGQQFKVEEGKRIFVHHLDVESGKKVKFDQVLLIEDEGKVIIGEPVIKDALVEGKILDQVRGDKVIVFKKKRKKGYRIRNGHRQNFTQVEIISIKEKADKKAVKKDEAGIAEVPEKTEAAETRLKAEKPVSKKTAPSKVSEKSGAAEKKAAGKKSAEKPAAKKPASKKSAKGKE